MQRKGDWEHLAPKRGFGKYNFNMEGKTNDWKSLLLCSLCHSYEGKIVDGKKVQLHRIPKDTKARRLWIEKLRNARINISSKPATRVCNLHFEGRNGAKLWC